ncbi:MAG: hypothetical protein IT186_08805 [Acidobacteria bacterium]|nr:hypothetical protein [Acidobacteriota bacterium]MCG3192306.1 hypothetical protein [Thermoanaerobaculia bacterium]
MTLNVRTTLRALHIPHGRFAAAIGARPETLCRWMKGTNRPRADFVYRILAFLNQPSHLEQLGRTEPFRLEELFSEEAA